MKNILAVIFIWLIGSTAAFALVDINTATQSESESLSGIGPSKAQAIIEYRKKTGGFKSVEELDQVPGIGAATMANLRKDITINGKQKSAISEVAKTDKKQK